MTIRFDQSLPRLVEIVFKQLEKSCLVGAYLFATYVDDYQLSSLTI